MDDWHKVPATTATIASASDTSQTAALVAGDGSNNAITGTPGQDCTECAEKITSGEAIACPEGKQEGCCPNEPAGKYFCCSGGGGKAEKTVCCLTGKQSCEYSIAAGTHYCSNTQCPADKQLCPAGNYSACCNKADDPVDPQTCGKYGWPFKMAYCKRPCDKTDPKYCDGQCCTGSEKCAKDPDSGLQKCLPTECDTVKGESLHSGTGSFADITVCCKANETFWLHPNGYPYCEPGIS